MKNIKRQLLKIIRPMAQKVAEDLADLLLVKIVSQVAKLESSFDAALSSFASELDDEQTENLPAVPPTKVPAARPAPRAKTLPDPATGKRRNHCKTCGAAGFQTKTCGRTHNIGGVADAVRPTRRGKAQRVAEDEEEGPVVAVALPVVADKPLAPKDPPRGTPVARRAPLMVEVPTVIARYVAPAPKKVVDRDKAIREIRAEKLRRAALKRDDLRQDKEAKENPLEPVASIADEESEWEASGLSEDDSVKLSSAQIALD